ncbi:General stress protein 69 [Planococcus massiliensis]|uniref:General stress protein 69 n=1 Tax=Planococcus massiliensis TaxID=1499687 RepID=A0A098EMM7_9BACL|nr:aldo/keto reductase [Planococcus massiliensis]CEG22556.1 General stress protein 69 [Planococcus massiliensis]
MKKRTLGTSNIQVSEIGFGCMSLPQELQEAQAIIDAAVSSGINYFDTADLYNKGRNEELVGKLLKPHRQHVVLATKVGNQWNPDSEEVKWNATKPYILEQVHNSLRRLQTDYIDLYQLHGGMITDSIDETIEAFEALKKDGLIREYGISSIRPNVIMQYLEKSDIRSIMMQYSLLDRRPEEYLEEIQKAGRSVVTRGSLAKGLLTNEGIARAMKTGSYMAYQERELTKTIKQLMEIHPNLHALSLHSVLKQPAIASIVAGASSPSQIEDTVKAYETTVSPEQIKEALSRTKQGRYQEHRD